MGYNFNKSATEHKWETIVIYNLFLIVSHCLLLFLIVYYCFSFFFVFHCFQNPCPSVPIRPICGKKSNKFVQFVG